MLKTTYTYPTSCDPTALCMAPCELCPLGGLKN